MESRRQTTSCAVIPGWPEGPGPESILPVVIMDSGLAALRRPGMTTAYPPYSACGNAVARAGTNHSASSATSWITTNGITPR